MRRQRQRRLWKPLLLKRSGANGKADDLCVVYRGYPCSGDPADGLRYAYLDHSERRFRALLLGQKRTQVSSVIRLTKSTNHLL